MKFFVQSEGKWRSQRITHHLPFRRAETGDSEIFVETLKAEDPKIIELCQLHQIEASICVGGASVKWFSSMAWDKEDENHKGSSIFAIVPDASNPKQGRLLRERGYAEIMPVVGKYHIDEEDALVLLTEYESISTFERFWFLGNNLRLRTSTVKGIGGGFSTATFSCEMRVQENNQAEESNSNRNQNILQMYSISGW